jgi:hypothetical protein
VLMFAGTADRRAPLRDFWAWDGHQWTLLPNDSGPSARDAAILTYDTKRRRAVLYGGRSPNGTALHDTWEWDGNLWTQRDTIGPGPRVHAVGAYDPERSQVLVHGGVSPRDEFLSDTWMWDGQRWSEAEKSQPIVRVPSGMAFDPASRRVVMLAHPRDSAGSFTAAELLEWTGRSWSPLSATRITTEPIQPIASDRSGSMVTFIGPTGETWARTPGGAWQKRTSTGPGPRSAQSLAYDAARQRIVLFGGGIGQGRFGDTWEWDGARWDIRGPVGPTR